jgi:hypothetical protein
MLHLSKRLGLFDCFPRAHWIRASGLYRYAHLGIDRVLILLRSMRCEVSNHAPCAAWVSASYRLNKGEKRRFLGFSRG